jgi:tetratricopeptide (TPR) repeat protein
MKRTTATLLTLFIISGAWAQTLAEKIGRQSCPCLGNIQTLDSLDLKFRTCFGPAMAEVMDNNKNLNFSYTVENVQRVASEAFESLPSVCPAVTRLVLEKRKGMFYGPSASSEANKSYEKGNARLAAGDLEGAIKEFKNAVRSDDKFVTALDNLAMCYRRMDQLQDAIGYYHQSLNIFPEGEFALINTGAIYLLQNELDKAGENYAMVAALYPVNPEGHFGLAKIALLQEKYADALAPVCEAYRIYASTKSPHVLESEKIIGFIYSKLKEAGREDFFQKTLQQYNIEFNVK